MVECFDNIDLVIIRQGMHMYRINYDVVREESTSRPIELRAAGEVFVADESILRVQLQSRVVLTDLNANETVFNSPAA